MYFHCTPEFLKDNFKVYSETLHDLLPHPLVLLCCGEDFGLSEEYVTEGPAATALLVEARYWADGHCFDGKRLEVGDDGLLRHHAANITDVPEGERAQGEERSAQVQSQFGITDAELNKLSMSFIPKPHISLLLWINTNNFT